MVSNQIGDAGAALTIDAEQQSGVVVADSGDIEEGRDAYRKGGFHPVYIGDVYANKYEVMRKIGYGRYSTVWLVKDLATPSVHQLFATRCITHTNRLVTCRPNDEHRFRALKVLSAECYGQEDPIFEREILTHLRAGSRRLMGYKYICHLVDDFELEGPNGNHVCLVLELMGENLRTFGVWFKEDMVPTPIMRKFTLQLVAALDYAHDRDVIHTDMSMP